jgi:hypothetical protein
MSKGDLSRRIKPVKNVCSETFVLGKPPSPLVSFYLNLTTMTLVSSDAWSSSSSSSSSLFPGVSVWKCRSDSCCNINSSIRASCGGCGWVHSTTPNNQCAGMVSLRIRFFQNTTFAFCGIARIVLAFLCVCVCVTENAEEYGVVYGVSVLFGRILYVLLPKRRMPPISVLRKLFGLLCGRKICLLQHRVS